MRSFLAFWGGGVLRSGARGLSLPWRAIMRFVCRFTETRPLDGPEMGWWVALVRQGRRDSNPQPSVLETEALPIELLPSGRARPGRQVTPGTHPASFRGPRIRGRRRCSPARDLRAAGAGEEDRRRGGAGGRDPADGRTRVRQAPAR